MLPIYLLVDLLFATRRRGLPWKTLFVIVGYPIAWITYTMIRGELIPDPFGLEPLVVSLPDSSTRTALGAGHPRSPTSWCSPACSLGIGAITIAIGRFRERRAIAREAAAEPVGALQA